MRQNRVAQIGGGGVLALLGLLWLAAPAATSVVAVGALLLAGMGWYWVIDRPSRQILGGICGLAVVVSAARALAETLPGGPGAVRLAIVLLAYLVVYLFGALWLLSVSGVFRTRLPVPYRPRLGWGGLAAWSAAALVGAVVLGIMIPVR